MITAPLSGVYRFSDMQQSMARASIDSMSMEPIISILIQ